MNECDFWNALFDASLENDDEKEVVKERSGSGEDVSSFFVCFHLVKVLFCRFAFDLDMSRSVLLEELD